MQSTMHITKTYEKGNTVYFETAYRNINADLTDPMFPSASIHRQNGDIIYSTLSGGPYKRATGLWYFRYAIPEVGNYYIEWTGIVEDVSVTYRHPFRVLETTKKT